MRKLFSVVLSAVTAMGLCFSAGAEALPEEDPAVVLLEEVKGTYEELFTVICAPEYDQLWLDDCQAMVGEEMAADVAEMLKSACTGTIYGEEAVAAYGDGSEGAQFDCYFVEGVANLVFDGDVISGTDENGDEVFSHTYAPAGEFSLGGMMDGYLYESQDPDSGEFTYFLLMPDTPASTQHIEFRYGSDLEDLAKYNEGRYAYWLAAGILKDCEPQMIEDVIALFCSENLAEMGEEEAAAEEASEEASEEATEDTAAEDVSEVVEIGSVEELKAVSGNLAGNYVLTEDLDLAGEEWTPLGSFSPMGEGEEQEIPDPAFAFTGTFDGQGHTISNLVINQPEGMALGLFGCIAGAEVGNFTLENVTVDACMMGGGVAGYANESRVYDVKVTGAAVTGHGTEMYAEGMYAAVVGAGMGGVIEGCQVENSEVTVGDGSANAGLVGGGLEGTSVIGCTASGKVNAGNDCYGLGGVSGCGFGSPEFTDSAAQDVVITAGENTFWVGGVVGYAGGYEDEAFGVPVTVLKGCAAENVEVNLGEGSEEAGEIVGAGFFNEEYGNTYGAPYDAPTVFVIE